MLTRILVLDPCSPHRVLDATVIPDSALEREFHRLFTLHPRAIIRIHPLPLG